jgi:hypothetical protein
MSKKNELRELLDLIKFKTGKTQADIADEIGYKRTYLSEALSKPSPPKKLVTNLRLKYQSTLDNKSSDNSEAQALRESPADYKKPVKDLSLVAITNLTESNRLMAESQVSLAKSHEDLVAMVKTSTANAAKETLEAVGAKLLALQEFVIEQSVKKQPYHSKEEAAAALSIKTGGILKKK